MDLLLVAFAAFFLTELAKDVLRRFGTPDSLAKLLLSGIVAGAASAVLVDDVATAVVTALGGAGLAALAHKAHRWLSAAGDVGQATVLQAATRHR